MSDAVSPGSETIHDKARAILRERVLEVGGLEGVFREFREDSAAAGHRYNVLRSLSITPLQRARNLSVVHQYGIDNPIDAEASMLEGADRNDMSFEDVAAFVLAASTVIAAGLDLYEQREMEGE
jgi:hypothetical protein